MRRLSLLFLFAIACDSPTGDGVEPTPPTEPTTTDGTSTEARMYSSDWTGVEAMLLDHCTVCHAEGGVSDFLVFPEDLAEDLLTEAGVLVVPGDSEASLLWQVLVEQASSGAEVSGMPPTGALAPSERDHVREWIDGGALHPFADVDLDGDGFSTNEGDCDDTDPTIGPGASEVCGDGLDNDCSGDADGEDAVDASVWYPDTDNDGWGSSEPGVEITSCIAPPEYVDQTGDCDDTDPIFNPEATEDDCTDPNDYNCDGSVGFADADSDGWAACEDCDDTTGLANPDGTEVCGDGLDNDCSGTIDGPDATDASQWFSDGDGDGHGDPLIGIFACTAPPDHVALDDDCDDADPMNFPGNPEICDTFDNDCSGMADDGAVDAPTWWPDLDQDGFGDPLGSPAVDCVSPPDHASNDSDCLDSNPFVNPDQIESQGNSLDDDCDGQVDEPPLSLASDVQPILDLSCNVGCHGAAFPSDGLDLTNAYAELVNVPSKDVPGMDLVEPTNPSASYLWHKLESTHLAVGGAGVAMPKNAPLLPQADRQLVEQWIVEGALP